MKHKNRKPRGIRGARAAVIIDDPIDPRRPAPDAVVRQFWIDVWSRLASEPGTRIGLVSAPPRGGSLLDALRREGGSSW